MPRRNGRTSNPDLPGGHRRMTALAEGPFTTLKGAPLTVALEVPLERLTVGPVGGRFAVQVRAPRSLRTQPLALAPADEPWGTEDVPCPSDVDGLLGDRRFLAQHGYAVATSTLELFESTLGRRLPWRTRGHRLGLKLFEPIPFELTGYDAQRGEIRFGHYRDPRSRRHVPLALYRDLVAHEVTHAILDGYRPHLSDPDGTPDEHAMHEGIADVVALLSVFSSVDRVSEQLAATNSGAEEGASITDRLAASGLFGIADGLFSRRELRRSVTAEVPPGWRAEREPHHRGEVLVHALMETVLEVWRRRMDRPGGRSSNYQIAASGATAGRQVLAMLIRGIGYTPPVDVTFEDLLRGILAADLVVVPDDDLGYRQALRTAFTRVGLDVSSDGRLDGLSGITKLRYPVRLAALGSDPEEVYRFLWENPVLLRAAAIDPDTPVVVERVRPSQRMGADGFAVSEIGSVFTQQVPLTKREAWNRLGLRASGPVVLRGGGLLRFDEGGRLTYAALKPVLDAERQQARLDEAALPASMETSVVEIGQRRAGVFASMHATDG